MQPTTAQIPDLDSLLQLATTASRRTTMYIPSDILSQVFTHAAADSLPTLTAIRISHVCSHWRLVALSISRLWNHFDCSLGIPIAQLQMSRVSPNVPISVQFSDLDDLHPEGHPARMTRWHIHRWLTEAQIITFPRWNALNLTLSGETLRESVVKVFDMLSDRNDELGFLVIRLVRAPDAGVVRATYRKLHFRPRHFHLNSWVFPGNWPGSPLHHASSFCYEGGRRTEVAPPLNFTLEQLSRAIFHHSCVLVICGRITAPSLTSLYLDNALRAHFETIPLTPAKINRFSPGLQHLQIVDIHCNLLLWMVPQSSLPNLLTLSLGRCHYRGGRPSGDEASLVQTLVNMDVPSTFPILQKLALQNIPTPPHEFESLLQSLPASTTLVILIGCPQSNTISVDLMRATHGINLSIQLCGGEPGISRGAQLEFAGEWESGLRP